MGKEELIKCFQDTLGKSTHGSLKQRTLQAVKSNRVYKEGFISKAKHRNENAAIVVSPGTTFDVAKGYCSQGKTAVLNFANPENPGGGVHLGAMAQEECLCRSSNLYACISSPNVFDAYYGYHKAKGSHFYTDRLIYTKNVTVFKDDSLVPQMLPETDWFDVDVITCAAPYLAKRKHTNGAALLNLFKSRVKNIFEAARDNGVEYLILGAFGCGAFKNPPIIVAEAFLQTIKEQDYFKDFKQIVFAIKPSKSDCPNLDIFGRQFAAYAPGADECCTLLPEPLEWRLCRCPALPAESRFSDNRTFGSWQMHNHYFGKQFSILGDSISTLEGFNPKGYKVFYADNNCAKSGVMEAKDTWWDKVIGFFGGELLVNNSWSGSRVTKLQDKKQLFPSGCSDERTAALHINEVKPDVILVYLGTNDWAFGAKTGNETKILGEDDNELFDQAYDSMLKKLRANYPESEIWCCTLCETYISKHPDFQFPHKHAGTHIEEYNEIIRNAVRQHNCKLVDLYNYKMAYDSMDGTHPTDTGMNTIATMVIRSIAGSDADPFLDCQDGQHEYKAVEEYTGGTRYVCARCGKTEHKSSLPDQQEETLNGQQNKNIGSENEYVMLDPDITVVLYSETLRLTIESTGKELRFHKQVVHVGKNATCDLLFSGKATISRQHATFFYERNMWFLCDNFSTNGTWINGARMEPGKKYQLATNDEILFAFTEKVIFDKHVNDNVSKGDLEDKALIFLEAGMATFAKSNYQDEAAWKLIIAALIDAPLYFPVEIDLGAMLGNIDPTKLKPGDTIQPQKNVRVKILTLSPKEGLEAVPAFTSTEEANKGPAASMMRFYPQDYLPKIMAMDKPVIINPFSDARFLLSKQIITDILWPSIQQKAGVQYAEKKGVAFSDNLVGKTIGDRYKVLKLLGQGGFFQTYLVMDDKTDLPWAMKVCSKQNKNYSPTLRKTILQEPHMMMQFAHPAIPKVKDILEDENRICIVREFLEGHTLDVLVRNNGPIQQETVIGWAKQLCDALGYLHKQKPSYIHRDVKPANIILMPDGKVKIIDFGIAMAYDPSKQDDTIIGTRGYAAPEQYAGRSDCRTDIFALGMTMHYLLTGIDPNTPPYETKPIRTINPQLSAGLERIIAQCVSPNPDDRFQTCEELAAALNEAVRKGN